MMLMGVVIRKIADHWSSHHSSYHVVDSGTLAILIAIFGRQWNQICDVHILNFVFSDFICALSDFKLHQSSSFSNIKYEIPTVLLYVRPNVGCQPLLKNPQTSMSLACAVSALRPEGKRTM